MGPTHGHLGGSAYWAEVLDTVAGAPPPIDLVAERAVQDFLVVAAERGLLRSAHDLSDGGLAVALAECCMGGPWSTQVLGARISLSCDTHSISDPGWLFGEDAARAIVSCAAGDVPELRRLGSELGVDSDHLGHVGEREGLLEIARGARHWQWPARRLRQVYMAAIPRRMSDDAFTDREG